MLMSFPQRPIVIRRLQSRSLGLVRRGNTAVLRRNRISLVALTVTWLLAASVQAQPLRLPATFGFDAFDRDRDANASEKATSKSDGVYGRFEGELSLEPFVGSAWTRAGMLTELGISAYYFHTVGLQVKYADGRLFPLPGDAPFSISTVSFTLRPLFLLRWSKDLEQGPSFLDLTIDSLTLKVGGYWSEKRDSDASKRGLETELSLGFPLLAEADGPWLSLAVIDRYPEVTNDGHNVDIALCLRFEWAFSLGR